MNDANIKGTFVVVRISQIYGYRKQYVCFNVLIKNEETDEEITTKSWNIRLLEDK